MQDFADIELVRKWSLDTKRLQPLDVTPENLAGLTTADLSSILSIDALVVWQFARIPGNPGTGRVYSMRVRVALGKFLVCNPAASTDHVSTLEALAGRLYEATQDGPLRGATAKVERIALAGAVRTNAEIQAEHERLLAATGRYIEEYTPGRLLSATVTRSGEFAVVENEWNNDHVVVRIEKVCGLTSVKVVAFGLTFNDAVATMANAAGETPEDFIRTF
jgi:hypothetical protein